MEIDARSFRMTVINPGQLSTDFDVEDTPAVLSAPASLDSWLNSIGGGLILRDGLCHT